MEGTRKPFPSEPELFGADPRYSFDKVAQAHIIEAEDGTEWQWMPAVKKWTQTITAEEAQQQAEAYKIAGVDEDAPALNPAQKRKQAQMDGLDANPRAGKSGPGASHTADAADNQDDAKSTSLNDADGAQPESTAAPAASATAKPTPPNSTVYVTGLPLDTDPEEIRRYFEKKFGYLWVNAENVPNSGVRMYSDDDGNFKGEASIRFNDVGSAENATWIDDGNVFQSSDNYRENHKTLMSVTYYDNSYSKAPRPAGEAKRPPKQLTAKEKAARKARQEETQLALEAWDSEEEELLAKRKQTKKVVSKPKKIVVVKKAFSLYELDEDEGVVKNVHEDMKEVCEGYGEVKNITVYDLEPLGVVTIRFSTEEAAEKCAAALQGKGYGGRQLATSVDDGSLRFKKSKKKYIDKAEDESERLENFSKFIEGED